MKFNKKDLYIIYLLIFVGAMSGSTLLNSCKKKTDNIYKLTGDTIKDGEYLVQQKCASCHQLAPPTLLSKAVWINHILPDMAKYLHISTYGGTQYFKNNPLDTAGITLENWLAIVNYYNKAAPEELTPGKRPAALINDWGGFTLKKPGDLKVPSYTTMVAVNPDTHKIYSADGSTERLYEWDKSLDPRLVTDLLSPVVDATFTKDAGGASRGIFTHIGQLAPKDFPNGRVVSIDLSSKSAKPAETVIASELARPVHATSGDFNKDGLTDYVICAQGFTSGGVYLMTQKPDHSYVQSNITTRAGAVQAVAGDFDNDGWQDIMVLYGTGDEGLWLYTNDRKGGFTSKNLLRFPPCTNSSDFSLADMNNDGKLDVVYTCGYNFYDSRILKPYHGLYIFTNKGDWKLEQSYFYPINGCTKAIVTDLNGDGKADIATIAFFADFKNNPAEGFIYFEQNKPMSFKPYAVPVSKYGRWMSMAIGDVNNDGKPDVVLGNFADGFMNEHDLKPSWNKNLPLIVLENHTLK